MNFIETIEIRNFKSIRHQKIEKCKRINVFIGFPNTGKSNILEALSLFSINEGNYNFCDFIRIEKLTTLFYNGDISDHTEVRIDEKYRFKMKFAHNKIEFKEQYETEGKSFEKADSGQHFLDDSEEVDTGRSFILSENKNEVTDYSKGYIRDKSKIPTIRRYEYSKRVSNSTKNYSYLDYPHGNNIFNIISTNPNLKKEVEELFSPYKLELLYDSRDQKFTILKRTAGGIFSIPYDLVADTLQRLVFYKAAILSNNNSVLLFEEPEAHMYPPYISKFTSDVNYIENGNQFFITTHSPFVINDFIENVKEQELSVFVVGYKKENGETIVRRLNKNEIHEINQFGIDVYMNLENYLPHEQ